MSGTGDIAVLGAGMHPWGKWGRSFIEYGTVAVRAALADAGLDWPDVRSVVGAETVRGGYPGYVAGATFARALGWQGARVTSVYAACASGAQAINTARAQILSGMAEVVLVVGADAAPKGFFAPAGGERPDDPDWLRFRVLGATNPAYFGLYARRRMALHGDTPDDFARVKVKNAAAGALNPYARYRKAVTAEEVAASAVVADPLRLLDICATSDGAAALVLCGMDYARRRRGCGPGSHTGRLHGHAHLPEPRPGPAGHRHRFGGRGRALAVLLPRLHRTGRLRGGRDRARGPVAGRGVRPVDRPGTGVVRGSGAVRRRGGREARTGGRDGARRSRSGQRERGLASFGEAVPAQAIAQVCELTWQLRGTAGERQIDGARTGITANQGLFGHGSSVIAVR